MPNMMRVWLRAATEDERHQLAFAAGTTRGYLNQLAIAGHREPRPALAADIERVTLDMHEETGGRLPVLYRTDLVRDCRQCEFARKCLGDEVVNRAEFEVVEERGGRHAR